MTGAGVGMRGAAGRSARRRLAVASLAVAVFVSAYALAVHTIRGQRVEQRLLDTTDFAYPAILDAVSVPAIAVAALAIAITGLLTRRPRAAAVGVGAIVVSSVLGQVLKYGVLERPALHEASGNSMPSGHMIAYASVVAAALLVLPAAARLVAAPLGAALLAIVGAELVHSSWHRPSDVIASLSLVVAVIAVGSILLGHRGERRPRAARAVLGMLIVVAAAAILLVGAAMLIELLTSVTLLPLRLSADIVLAASAAASMAAVLVVATPARGDSRPRIR